MALVKGTVKWWDELRAFGFLTQDDGADDIYCDFFAIERDGCMKVLAEGQKVEFERLDTPEGPKAINVRRVFDESGTLVTVLCGDAVQVRFMSWGRADLRVIAERVKSFGEVYPASYLVRLRAAPYELTVFDDGRAIVKGCDDPVLAQSLVKKWLGDRIPVKAEDPDEPEHFH